MPRIRTTQFLLSLLLAVPPVAAAQGAGVAPAGQGARQAALARRGDPALAVVRWRDTECVADRLLVTFAPGAPESRRASARAALGSRSQRRLRPGLELLELAPGADLEQRLLQAASLPGVLAVQPDALVPIATPAATAATPAATAALPPAPPAPPEPPPPPVVPDDPKLSQQWHLPKVSAFDAWGIVQGSPGVVIAVLDSGVRGDHADLDAQFAWGDDPYAGDSDPSDAHGHGTHVIGLAAAETGNGLGVAGASYGCRFAAYRCGNASFPTSTLVLAIDAAVAAGAQVLSMSWGSSYDNPALRSALQRAHDAGCVLVAAAGNDGATTPFYPAAWDIVVGVASSAPNDGPSSFTNRGPWVSVAAPGQAMVSTLLGGGYGAMSGTSMACPVVAGLAGLLYSQLGGVRSQSHAASVRQAIESSAHDVGSWVAHGRVDFAAAVASLAPPAGQPPHLSALQPDTRPVLGEQVVQLGGSGLLGATAVLLDGNALPISVADDSHASFTSPAALALGTHPVLVEKTGTTSEGLALDYTVTAPADLLAPQAVDSGASLQWRFGGPPGQHWVLVLSLAPATAPVVGLPVLADVVVARVGLLDVLGLGTLQALALPALAGETVYAQVLMGPGWLATTTPVRATTITP